MIMRKMNLSQIVIGQHDQINHSNPLNPCKLSITSCKSFVCKFLSLSNICNNPDLPSIYGLIDILVVYQ